MRGLSSPVPPAGSVPPIPRRRQPPPTHCGASRRNGRDLIIAKNDQRTSPYPRCCQRQRRRRYKQSPEPTTIPAVPIPRSQHRQIYTCPPRAKGSLNRRSKWFSLVPFFLQKKKGTRAGGTKLPIPRPQAQRLFAAARAFPHVTGVFLIVVVPPTVPAQLSAAAACYYGKNYSFCRVAG